MAESLVIINVNNEANMHMYAELQPAKIRKFIS